MIFAVVLLVSFLDLLRDRRADPPDCRGRATGPPPGLARSSQASQGPLSPFWWVVAILIIGFVLAVAGYVVWALVSIVRAKSVSYEDLSPRSRPDGGRWPGCSSRSSRP